MSNAKTFTDTLSPYRNRYIAQTTAQPNPAYPAAPWFTVEHYLTDAKIERAILGTAIFGYFLSTAPRAFGIDIDDHTNKGQGYLLSVYEQVCLALGKRPSILSQSPHGLHPFYFLTYPVPEILLIDRLQQLLAGIPVEIKPTHSVGMRIPSEASLLDPRTCYLLNRPFEAVVNEARHYHPLELLSIQASPAAVRSSLKDRQETVTVKTWEKLAEIQAHYQHIKTGTTNTVLCELIPIYRSLGLSEQDAAANFAALFAPDYTGELRVYRRLERRIASFYRNEPDTQFNTLAQSIQPDLFTQQIAEAIAALLTGPTGTRQEKAALTRMRGTVKKGVLFLETWKAKIDLVKAIPHHEEMWNYLYPYFKKNTGEGYYPIPRNLFKKLREHYELYLLPFFKHIGYLERAPYQYASGEGICYYYKINGGQFIERWQAPKPVVKTKAQERADQIRAYKAAHPEATTRMIGAIFGVTAMTVSRVLRGL